MARQLELKGRTYWILSEPHQGGWKACVTEVRSRLASRRLRKHAARPTTPPNVSCAVCCARTDSRAGNPKALRYARPSASEDSERVPAPHDLRIEPAAGHQIHFRLERDVYVLCSPRPQKSTRLSR